MFSYVKVLKPFFLLSLFLNLSLNNNAQSKISLYESKIPNSIDIPDEEKIVFNKEVDTVIYKVSRPSLSVHMPIQKKASGPAVIIYPGGGYQVLCIKMEGIDIAKAFNKIGVTAFVLKYRLPSDKTMKDKSIGPLQDAQRAIQLVRQRAAEWNIDPHKIGIMGFSAGGHLAASEGTHFDHALIENKDNINLRPDFMILISPVISFTDRIGHIGSRDNLLGKSPSQEEIRFFSNENNVSLATPPTLMIHAGDDSVSPVANSLEFYEALRKNTVPAELHIYHKGGHDISCHDSSLVPFEEWFGRCQNWMKSNGWL